MKRSAPWIGANQRHLAATFAWLRTSLQAAAESVDPGTLEQALLDVADAAAAVPGDPALDELQRLFNLSTFERSLVALCAAAEFDARVPALCGAAQRDSARAYPTFSLALSVFDDAHWSAIDPGEPLRRWRIIEVDPGSMLTTARLRVDERILHWLAGVDHLDERLAVLGEPLLPADVTTSQRQAAGEITRVWASGSPPPVVVLRGAAVPVLKKVAAAACADGGADAWCVPAAFVPVAAGDLDTLAQLWAREVLLTDPVLVVDCRADTGTSPLWLPAIARLVDRNAGKVLLIGRDADVEQSRPSVTITVPPSSRREQVEMWRTTLANEWALVESGVPALASQFAVSAADAAAVAVQARANSTTDTFAEALWDTARERARPRLEGLAARVPALAGWDDLILPPGTKEVLAEILAHTRQRWRVYDEWGFADRSGRGLSLTALFAGPSGTGKTMAAEVLARELRLDLYRIDLSQVVSKYIGETEKNLGRVFDAAESGGVILLFDEADALFGKRTEVKDSHDRYANLEVSYLLQRMETYSGLAILTTNMKDAVDSAFQRRIRFVVTFPFPDAAQRAEIWRRVFPPAVPVEGLDITQLARMNVTGGSIRNIALHAAFLAADAGTAVEMRHLIRAARVEYGKLERPLTAAEIGGRA
jgi:hypothetical protein